MGKPVTHFEVHGKDTQALQKFYGELFDWHVDSNNPMNYGMVDTHGGERGINGGIAPDDESWVTFYVEVDDLAAALKRAEELGGQTIMQPTDVPGGPTLAMFTDPAGNKIGLAKGM